MSKKKKSSILPRVELMVIGLFVCFFLVWSVSRCNATRAKYAAMEESTTSIQEDSTSTEVSAPSQVAPQNEVNTRAANELPRTIRERYTPLYVSIENLNVRADPSRSGKILTVLKLFEEVTFLNEVTNFEDEINLGFEVAKEPWIKIKTERGYVGWVFGAGVHYYKKSRKPIENSEESPETITTQPIN